MHGEAEDGNVMLSSLKLSNMEIGKDDVVELENVEYWIWCFLCLA